MVEFREQDLFPRYIREDETGNALIMAISGALRTMCRIVQDGKDAVLDVEKMPEWRLDEMAWETNCVYNYEDTEEEKRRWIRDAERNEAVIGTAEGLKKFLKGRFVDVTVEESGYDGWQPFHFRILVSGVYSAEAAAWAVEAVNRYKNVRSVLDSFTFNGETVYADAHYHAAVVGTETVATARAE